jgi:predicted PurR-regulated permease PerM
MLTNALGDTRPHCSSRSLGVRSHRFQDAEETTIRLGLVLALLVWCFLIVRPFITPIVWSFIIAVAVAPVYRRLTAVLGGRRELAAAVLVLIALALFVAPAARLSDTMVGVYKISPLSSAAAR